MRALFILILSFFITNIFAQPLPDTEIFLADIQIRGDSFRLGKPINITEKNGYDNQPCFLPDNSGLYFVSMQPDSQPDVFRYDFKDHASKRITTTKEHEYSPTPSADGKSFSTVRIETDSVGTQRLWKIDNDGTNASLILKEIKQVGYHCRYDEKTIVLFLATEPPKMVIATTGTEDIKPVAENIGRCIQKIPRSHAVSFVQKENDSVWTIKKLDMTTHQVTPVASTLPQSEDYTWTKEGTILMGKGNKLYKLNPARDKDWQQIADFSDSEIKEFSRIAISPANDKLAIVGLKKKE